MLYTYNAYLGTWNVFESFQNETSSSELAFTIQSPLGEDPGRSKGPRRNHSQGPKKGSIARAI